VKTDPAYSAAHLLLGTWQTITDPIYKTIAGDEDHPRFDLVVDGKTVNHAGPPNSLRMPASNVFQMTVAANSFAGSYDQRNGNRRSEIAAIGPDKSVGTGVGEMAWTAFCIVLGDHPSLTAVRSGAFGIVHQWHSVEYGLGRSPIVTVSCFNNELSIRTRSSVGATTGNPSGTEITHYSTVIPAKGIKTFFVLQITFGEAGHINAWINGTQVVNQDAPIGYYADLVVDPSRKLGYPQWGLYCRNYPETNVVYIANPEWGVASLSDRIAAPLPVPDLTW